MVALNLPESTAQLKASVKDSPEARQLAREALAEACKSEPATALAGFTRIEPYRPRRDNHAMKNSSR